MATRPSNAVPCTSKTTMLRVKTLDQIVLVNRDTTENFHPVTRYTQTVSENKTLSDADHMSLIVVDTGGVDVTVPAGLRDDFRCEFIFTAGSGDLTLVASSTTIQPSGTLNITAQYGKADLDAIASDSYIFSGDVA